MADYTRRVVDWSRVEFVVPAPEPWGAHSAEVGRAFSAATQEAKGITPPPDIFMVPGEGELVVYFQTQRERRARVNPPRGEGQ